MLKASKNTSRGHVISLPRHTQFILFFFYLNKALQLPRLYIFSLLQCHFIRLVLVLVLLFSTVPFEL